MASDTSLSKATVLSKATLNAAKHLGVSQAELAKLLGISETSASQIEASERFLDPTSQEGERALMLVHIFRTLDALVGGDAVARVSWMSAYSAAIGDLPKHAIQTLSGLGRTQAYLNSLVAGALDGQASRRQ